MFIERERCVYIYRERERDSAARSPKELLDALCAAYDARAAELPRRVVRYHMI